MVDLLLATAIVAEAPIFSSLVAYLGFAAILERRLNLEKALIGVIFVLSDELVDGRNTFLSLTKFLYLPMIDLLKFSIDFVPSIFPAVLFSDTDSKMELFTDFHNRKFDHLATLSNHTLN